MEPALRRAFSGLFLLSNDVDFPSIATERGDVNKHVIAAHTLDSRLVAAPEDGVWGGPDCIANDETPAADPTAPFYPLGYAARNTLVGLSEGGPRRAWDARTVALALAATPAAGGERGRLWQPDLGFLARAADAHGPWIWDDLELIVSGYKYLAGDGANPVPFHIELQEGSGSSGIEASAAAAAAAAEADFAWGDWYAVDAGADGFYARWTKGMAAYEGDTQFTASIDRVRARITFDASREGSLVPDWPSTAYPAVPASLVFGLCQDGYYFDAPGYGEMVSGDPAVLDVDEVILQQLTHGAAFTFDGPDPAWPSGGVVAGWQVYQGSVGTDPATFVFPHIRVGLEEP